MSETREGYNATLQPGPELDILVARAMGKLNVLSYSTDSRFAMQAWEWLEENNPWKPDYLALMRFSKPCVCQVYYEINELTTGQTYPHAIALAVVEAGKVMGVIE